MQYGYTIVVGEVTGYPCLRSGDLEANLLEAIEVGADTVEIHMADPEKVDVEMVKEVTAGKLAISAVGTGLSCGKYGLSLTSDDKAVIAKAQEKLKVYIELAQKLDAAVIIGSIRGKNEGKLPVDAYEELFIESMQPVIAYAKECNTVLVLETINRYELPFFNSIADMAGLVRKINSPFLQVHIDTFHMNIEEVSVCESVASLKGILGHIHTADNTRLHPGSGTFDFVSFKKALDTIGYEKSMSMECFNPKEEKSSIIAGLKFMRQL